MKSLFRKSINPKFLSIYIRYDGHLFLIPSSFNKENWIVETDYFNEVAIEDNNNDLLNAVLDTLSKCNVLEAINFKDKSQISPICKATGYKTYSMAVKGFRLISVKWEDKKGFTITPTKKKKGEGFKHIEEKSIECNEEDLIEAIRTSIELAIIESE